MKIGIIGLKNSGKTTVFNALTGLNAEITTYTSTKAEPNLGIVEVIDERLTKLAEMYEQEKAVYAHIEFMDFIGFSEHITESEIFSSSFMTLAKTADAIAVVVRNFESDIFTDTLSPIRDIETIESELIISDFIIAEKRLEKIELSKKRGIKDAQLLLEEKVIRKAIENLNNSIPLRDLSLNNEEEMAIRGFQFISQKPVMIILNSKESNFHQNESLIQEIGRKYKVIEFAGKFEMELNNLSTEEAGEFMEDMNIKESARKRLTKFAYELLGYISFFTVGKDEVRAWTIIRGTEAVEAAGKIHTDMERGFIRAECFTFDELIEAGSEKHLREKGLFRLEGKKYIVKDGDLLKIRFNV